MSEEKNLHIDEGWKAQVEREKAQIKQPQPTATAEEETPQRSAPDNNSRQEPPPPPVASFQFLVASLATQAMACLGQIPDDDGKPLPVNLPYAKHFIDLLGIIEDKTRTNLDEGEAAYLKGALHQLRLQFVESSRH
jgi:hypothetical protein